MKIISASPAILSEQIKRAARKGELEQIKSYINAGGNIDIRYNHKKTLLMELEQKVRELTR